MRTLNKTLCLVLCIALCFTFVGSAFAANTDAYTDQAKVGKEYFEAVDVMVGVGIINGTSATTLDPQGTYTREQAAKIITYMRLGQAAADNLKCTADPFADVKATDWAAPFIQYCVENNIIAGAGDGNFYPKNVVSGYEMGKMVLCALGYGVNDEYEGSAWAINVAKDGIKLGIFGDSTLQATLATAEKITREQAIYVAWEGLFEKTVTWSTLLDQYVTGNIFGTGVGDTTVTTTVYGTLAEVVFEVGKIDAVVDNTQFSTESSNATLSVWNDSKYGDKIVDTITVADDVNYASAGYNYNVYFKTGSKMLTVTADGEKYVDLTIRKGGLLGYYADNTSAAITALPVIKGVTTEKVFNAYVAAAGLSFPSSKNSTINYYYNYRVVSQVTEDVITHKSGQTVATAEDWAYWFLEGYKAGVFNGYTLIDNDNNGIIDTVAVTNYVVAEVASATSTMYSFEGDQASIKVANVKGDTLAAKDVALIYPVTASNYVVAKAATFKGAITDYTDINKTVESIVVDGKTYGGSNEIAFNGTGILKNAPSIANEGIQAASDNVGSAEQTFWVDPVGYVLGFTGSNIVAGNYDLSYISKFGQSLDAYDNPVYYAYVTFADGTNGSYRIDKYNGSSTVVIPNDTDHGIYNVTVKANGHVEVKDPETYKAQLSVTAAANRMPAPAIMRNGYSNLGSSKTGDGTTYALYANDTTIYFWDCEATNKESVKVYIGYKNSPTDNGAALTSPVINEKGAVYVVKKATGTVAAGNYTTYGTNAVAAYVKGTAANGIDANDTDIYFFDGSSQTYKKSGSTVTVTYKLWKDGVSEDYTVTTTGTTDPEDIDYVPVSATTQLPDAGFYRKTAVTNNVNGLVPVKNLTSRITALKVVGAADGNYNGIVYQTLASYSNNALVTLDAPAYLAAGAQVLTYFTTNAVKVIDTRAEHTDKYVDTTAYGALTNVADINTAVKAGYGVYFHVVYTKPDGSSGAVGAPYKATYIFVSQMTEPATKSTDASLKTITGMTVDNVNDTVTVPATSTVKVGGQTPTATGATSVVYDKNGVNKATGTAFATGDYIIVTAPDGKTTRVYTVTVVTAALVPGRYYETSGSIMRTVATVAAEYIEEDVIDNNASVQEVTFKDAEGFDIDVSAAPAAGVKATVVMKNGTTATYTISSTSKADPDAPTISMQSVANVLKFDATNKVIYIAKDAKSGTVAAKYDLTPTVTYNGVLSITAGTGSYVAINAAKTVVTVTTSGAGVDGKIKVTDPVKDTLYTEYTVKVVELPAITSFTPNGFTSTVISGTTNTIVIDTQAAGANNVDITYAPVASATLTYTGAGMIAANGTTIDLTASITGTATTVTATDVNSGFTRTYVVTFTAG